MGVCSRSERVIGTSESCRWWSLGQPACWGVEVRSVRTIRDQKRRVPIFVVAAAALFVIGCASGGGVPSQPPPGAIAKEEYISRFNDVTVRLLEDVTLMNQIAFAVVGDDSAQAGFEGTTRVLLQDLEEQLRLVESQEPVPPDVLEAHESLKASIMKYVEAASLLLPPQVGAFDFFEFQGLVAEGGKNFHSAGAALSSDGQ